MKYLKYSLLVFLCIFSFFVSDKLLLYVENLSPLMQTINEYKDYNELEPIDAIIDGNTIIPGKNGKVINKRESYLKMNDFGAFNDTFFVYDDIKPNISIKNNLDKIIIGSQDKQSVSIIIDNKDIKEYLLKETINFANVVKQEEDIINNDFTENINSNNDEALFYDLNYYLKKNKKNTKICLVGYSNINVCKLNKYYLVSPTLEVYKTNVANIKSKIEGGKIILIHDNVSLSEFKVLLQEIKYKGLNLVKLSEFISEK